MLTEIKGEKKPSLEKSVKPREENDYIAKYITGFCYNCGSVSSRNSRGGQKRLL